MGAGVGGGPSGAPTAGMADAVYGGGDVGAFAGSFGGDPGTIASGAGAGLPASIGIPAYGGSGQAGIPVGIVGGPLAGEPTSVGPSASPMLSNFFNAAQMAKGFIPNSPITGVLSGVLTAGQALARGEDFGNAIAKGFTALATNSIPFTGMMTDAIQGQGPIIGLGNLLGVTGQAPIGRGGEGTEGGWGEVGNGPTGEPSVVSAGASPVAEAMAPVQAPMLSSQPFGWYSQGMKRVNMPWVSQPGSQQLRYNQSGNYGGMKRV